MVTNLKLIYKCKIEIQSGDILILKLRHFADMSAFWLYIMIFQNKDIGMRFFLNGHKSKTDIQMQN